MSITWYLLVSAIVFTIGAGGVLVRRNPLVILLCIELMLNAANLALVAFARANGNQDGQIFAIVVMVVAACEVAVGLGLIVALYRRQPPDRRRPAQGAPGMTLTTRSKIGRARSHAEQEADGGRQDLRLAGPAVPAGGDADHLPRPLRAARPLPGIIGTLAIAGSFASAVGAFVTLQSLGEEQRQVVAVAWDYAVTAGVDAQVSILIDPLSVLMILVVSGVSTLIHLYSVGYMGSDRGYARFFAYLNFFVFSMLLLVLAANFFILIVGWAFVGAASYLLISFWYRRTTATAGRDQGVRDQRRRRRRPRVRDLLHLPRHRVRSTSSTTFERVGDVFSRNDGELVAGCLGLLVGAFAKSAQVPLHTWLPDAMEGPTPVSALIHAATMVTAGVYLIARMHPLFEQAPAAADVGAIIGCADAPHRRPRSRSW